MVLYDGNGNKTEEGPVIQKDDKPLKEGNWTEYNKSGQKITITPYENGLKEGTTFTFYDSGQIKSQIPYKGDLKEGISLEFDKNGIIKSKELYKVGVLIATSDKIYDGLNWSEDVCTAESSKPIGTIKYDSSTQKVSYYSKDGKLITPEPSIVWDEETGFSSFVETLTGQASKK